MGSCGLMSRISKGAKKISLYDLLFAREKRQLSLRFPGSVLVYLPTPSPCEGEESLYSTRLERQRCTFFESQRKKASFLLNFNSFKNKILSLRPFYVALNFY